MVSCCAIAGGNSLEEAQGRELIDPCRFEDQIEEGKLSRDGLPGSGGLEAVACGGMHTLAVDEGGRVSTFNSI